MDYKTRITPAKEEAVKALKMSSASIPVTSSPITAE
jgi:hypothetical protein